MTTADKLGQGRGPLSSSPDADVAWAIFRGCPKTLTERVMSVHEVVERFVQDGDYLASGGFGGDRITSALLHEIVRQK